MDGLPVIEIGILGMLVLCGFLVYVLVIAPKKIDQQQKMDRK